MTVIGDAMKKAGLEAPEPVESGEKHKLAFTQKVACMKSSIQNIVRLTGKYEKVLGDEQEEMDTLSALRSHFIDMTEAFKDMIDDIRVAKQKMDKSENAESLRFYIRYYTDFICPEDMPGDVEEALETFMLRNEASHRYDLREHVNHAILRGCTNYAQEYLDICKSVYDYAEQVNLILKK